MGAPFWPGSPGSFLGSSSQPSQGSDASFDVSSDVGAHLSLRQYCVGDVATYTYDSSGGNHIAGEDVDTGPDTNSFTWPPCTASFSEDTLPGSLLVCIGVLNADFYGFGSDDPNASEILIDAGLDAWGSDADTRSVFSNALGCPTQAGYTAQVPQATGILAFRANAPIVAAGRLFYGGVYSADFCNNFAYQMILAEFEVDGATLDSFSYNNTPVGQVSSGDPLSLTGRLPRYNPSFVIAVTWNNPGNGAAAGPGFTLASATSLGSQWQWQEFAAQEPDGYPSPQFPRGCPGLSGSFELGFNGSAVSGITPVGAFIWNVHPALGGGGGGGKGELDMFLPNVWINCREPFGFKNWKCRSRPWSQRRALYAQAEVSDMPHESLERFSGDVAQAE